MSKTFDDNAVKNHGLIIKKNGITYTFTQEEFGAIKYLFLELAKEAKPEKNPDSTHAAYIWNDGIDHYETNLTNLIKGKE